MVTFDEAKKKHYKKLKQYVPIVDRVHGGNHPEFHDVRRLFDTIVEKSEQPGNGKPDLNDEFAQLRLITNNYEIPADVCESYESVYNMLGEIDRAYHG